MPAERNERGRQLTQQRGGCAAVTGGPAGLLLLPGGRDAACARALRAAAALHSRGGALRGAWLAGDNFQPASGAQHTLAGHHPAEEHCDTALAAALRQQARCESLLWQGRVRLPVREAARTRQVTVFAGQWQGHQRQREGLPARQAADACGPGGHTGAPASRRMSAPGVCCPLHQADHAAAWNTVSAHDDLALAELAVFWQGLATKPRACGGVHSRSLRRCMQAPDTQKRCERCPPLKQGA